MVWGSNIPMTRTPDAHFLAEARYKGTKVVNISPDYAKSTKFADDWMSVKPGTDAALAIAMGHVILNEFYQQNQTMYFTDYTKQYTDFPFLVTLKKEGNEFVADRFLNAKDIGREIENGDWKTVLYNDLNNGFSIPKGTVGSRWDSQSNWNLKFRR